MNELLDCPFCGGEARLITLSYEEKYVICPGCYTTSKTYKTEAETIQAWNTRHERTCEPIHEMHGKYPVLNSALYCSVCDYKFGYSTAPNYCPNCGARVLGEQ